MKKRILLICALLVSAITLSGAANVITFTTAKAVGQRVRLYMAYTGDVPTLTGMTGTPRNKKTIIYTLTSQTVTIRGDVTSLSCDNNQITTLDVSKNTVLTGLRCAQNQLTALDLSPNTELTKLYCFDNQIKSEEMTRLVNSLPNRTGKEAGYFVVVREPASEGNLCPKSDVAIAEGKNWRVMKLNSESLITSDYEGAANAISFATAEAVGQRVRLYMAYTGDAPKLNGMTGTPVSGTEVTYTLTSQKVTITGDVTHFDCSWNQITSLDISRNTALIELSCNNNH